MILPCLVIAPTAAMGRGVHTTAFIAAGTVVEHSPVIVLPAGDRSHLDQTVLHDYIFEWGYDRAECCMALGYIPLYNHSYLSNCEYEMDFEASMMKITAMRAINAGEELFINYNGDWNDETPLWFDAR